MNEILDALKAKYQGVGDAILKVKATAMHKKGLAVSDVEATTWDEIILAYGDDRATQAAKTALAGVKPTPKPNTTPAATGGEQGKGEEPAPETTPKWVAELISQNKTLADRLAAIEGEKVSSARKSQIEALTNQLPENLRSPYKRIAVDGMTDEEFTILQGELKTEIEGIASTVKASGASFAAPPAKPGGAEVTEATAEQAAELIKNM